jgi:5-methylthioadenosine/S-adenosylhomocysteine deaminase
MVRRSGPLNQLVHLGVNLRGMVQSDPEIFHTEMESMLRRKLPVCIHASQTLPNMDDAADYERRGYLGPQFLFCHYIAATQSDREAMARTGTPLSFATLSEMRLSEDGDPRDAFMKMRAAGVSISLSSDATSLAPPNMFETMRATWNMAIPWRGTDTASMPPLGICETIEMATLRGAEALGLGSITGSLTPAKRADIILIDTDGVNIAPMAHLKTTILQSAMPAVVDTVMVEGRILKRHKHLIGFDVERTVDSAKRSALRIRAAAGGVLKPLCGCYGKRSPRNPAIG